MTGSVLKKVKGKKVPVSKRALIQRINRKLALTSQKIVFAEGRGKSHNLWVINTKLNEAVGELELDRLADWGRELEVLSPWEAFLDDNDSKK
jgi:hypothetical protein